MMMDLADTDTLISTSQPSAGRAPTHGEDHLADRYMFLKDFDLLDIDRGHFWHKLSWHGVHVEFPSRLHHYEPNTYEDTIRDYFVALPAGVLEDAFASRARRRTPSATATTASSSSGTARWSGTCTPTTSAVPRGVSVTARSAMPTCSGTRNSTRRIASSPASA